MTCAICEEATNEITQMAYYRIGNFDIGFGNIGLVGCKKHVKLALDRLNAFVKDAEKLQKILESDKP